MSNPFNITFGELPESFIGREKDTQLIRGVFNDETPESKVYVITGPRGSGKTALLTDLSNLFQKDGYLAVDLNPFGNMEEQLASKLLEAGKLKKLFLHPEFSFSFKGLTFSLKGNIEISNITTLLEKMFSYLKAKKKRVLVTIDDVSSNQTMKSFVFSYQQWVRQSFPVYLLMSGLYENVSEIEKEKSLTFFLRAPKLLLEPLDLALISYSYQKLLGIDLPSATKLAKLTKGYAYGYQLLGSLSFKGLDFKEILSQYDYQLCKNSYSLIWEKLSAREKDILFAMTKGSEQKQLCQQISMSNGNLQNYKLRLFEKGIISKAERGMMTFALPRFKEFVELQSLLASED